MPLKTYRWNDPREPDDGYRIWLCRFRPRGVCKADETWNAWCSELAPSRKLHGDFYGKNGPPIGWSEYHRRYLEEMEKQTELIAELADLVASGARITLLCSSACEDASHCHRTLLRELIEQEMKDRPSANVKDESQRDHEATQDCVDTAEPGAAETRRGRRKKSSPHSPA